MRQDASTWEINMEEVIPLKFAVNWISRLAKTWKKVRTEMKDEHDKGFQPVEWERP